MNKIFLQPLILLVLALCIWFAGPQIAIANKIWLASPEIRLGVILIMVLSWGLYYFILQWRHIKSGKSDSANISGHHDFDETWMTLHKHFSEIYALLKKQRIKNLWQRFRCKIPINLVIGNTRSGKTSLLLNSEINFTSIPAMTENFPQLSDYTENRIINPDDLPEIKEDTSICFWHFAQGQLFLDTPGDYASSEVKSKHTTPWLKLLKFLKLKRFRFPVKSVILVLNVPEIATQQPKQVKLTLHLLKQRLLELRKYYNKTLPLYIIFSKCDQIRGFREFFDHLNYDERSAALGIFLRQKENAGSMAKTFRQEYLLLLQRLNSLIIQRLHQEHNAEKRAAIRDFPAQMDKLKDILGEIILQLAEKTHDCQATKPMGVYFTSSMQTGTPTDLLQEIFEKNLSLHCKEIMKVEQIKHKPFFIKEFMHRMLLDKTPGDQNIIAIKPWQKKLVVTTSVILVTGFTVITAMEFKNDLLKISQNQSVIFSYQALKRETQNDQAANNARREILSNYYQASHNWIFNFLPRWQLSRHVSTLTDTEVHPAGRADSPLVSFLLKQLSDPNTALPALYRALKIYLMLGNPNQLDTQFILAWLSKQQGFQSQLQNPATRIQLLNTLVNQASPIQLNQTIIQQARQKLKSLPAPYLAYLILESDVENAHAPLTFTLNQKMVSVPFLYTAQGLQTLFLNHYQNTVKEALQGNPVLGDYPQDQNKLKESRQTTQQLLTLYANIYVNWWKSKLAELEFENPETLRAIADYLQDLTSDNHLIQALDAFQKNTNPDLIVPPGVNNTDMSELRSQLQQQFGNRFDTVNKINLNDLQLALNQINHFLNALSQTDKLNMASFVFSEQTFNHPESHNALDSFKNYTDTLGDPLKSAFSRLIDNVWRQIILNTQNYINQQWQSTVVSAYQHDLQDRYPIFHKAVEDTQLEDFSRFFSPGGIMQSFFQQYIAPFVNQQQSPWQWRTVDGKTLGFSANVLAIFERARIITAMFFPQDSQQCNVKFTLQPIAMMPIVKNFQLSLNGQSLNDQQGSQNISSFIWPGNSQDLNTVLTIYTVNGQHISTSQQGPWGWFHLLDKAQITPGNNTQKYTVIFDVDGNAVKYSLTADSPINPFISGIIENFRIPDALA